MSSCSHALQREARSLRLPLLNNSDQTCPRRTKSAPGSHAYAFKPGKHYDNKALADRLTILSSQDSAGARHAARNPNSFAVTYKAQDMAWS